MYYITVYFGHGLGFGEQLGETLLGVECLLEAKAKYLEDHGT